MSERKNEINWRNQISKFELVNILAKVNRYVTNIGMDRDFINKNIKIKRKELRKQLYKEDIGRLMVLEYNNIKHKSKITYNDIITILLIGKEFCNEY